MNQDPLPKPSPILHLIGGIGGLAGLWIWWLIENTTHFRFPPSSAGRDAISLEYPLIATPVILLVVFLWWRRDVGIIEHGEVLHATILNSGILSAAGTRNVTLSYQYDNQSFEVRKSLSEAALLDKKEGDLLAIIIDRRNPKRFIPR